MSYNHLQNKPQGEDLFKSKAHTKISGKLAEKIKEDKIKIFGLESGLGTGKSNVTLITKKLLKDTHRFFIFDAWGHQEDLQRRSLLEELTDFLCKNNIINKDIWEEKLKDLLARKSIETKNPLPHVSNAIIISVILIFLNGFFNNISNEAIKSILPKSIILWGQQTNFLLKEIILGLTKNFLLIGLIVISFKRIYSEAKQDERFKLFSKDGLKIILENFKELFFILKEKEIDKTISTITSTKEPSVREFNNWMNELGDDIDGKLVIVFDNMDRVAEDKVRALWTLIHTFFSEYNYPNISLVVPFDREQLNKMFKDSNVEEKNNEKEGDLLISKTFPKIYRVPALVLSDWETFFDAKIKEAFYQVDKEELIVIKTLYDLKTRCIKPREIINFINELVSLKEVWDEEIPLKYMALFILNKETILLNPLNEIIKRDYLKGIEHFFEEDKEVDDNISALVYGVSPEIASQVVLEREILSSLNNGRKENIKELTMVT